MNEELWDMIKEWTLKRDNNGGDIRIRLSPSGDVTVIYASGETRSFSRAEGRRVWNELIDAGWYAESLTPTMRPNRSHWASAGMNGPHENELMEARIDPKKFYENHIKDYVKSYENYALEA